MNGVKRLAGYLAVLVAMVSSAGCGGGRGPSTSSAQPLISFNTGITGPVADADRATAESSIQQKWGTLIGQPMSTQAQGVVAFMKSIKVLRAGGVSADGSCWGEYTDGVPLVIATNDPKLETIPPSKYVGTPLARPAFSRALIPRSRPAGKSKPSLLPVSPNAYVFDALEVSRNSSAPTIAGELKAKGYVTTYTSGSLSDWAGVTDAGILVASSHGGFNVFTKTLDINYMQEASDTVSLAADLLHHSDLSAGTLCHFVADEVDGDGNVHPSNHYGFSGLWLQNTGMFAKQSLMFNMACSGSKAPEFRQRLQFVLGLDVYGGWSFPVIDQDSFNTASFFFDRALGLNKVDPVDPSMPPPATWQSINSLLAGTQRSGSKGNFNQSFARTSPSVFGFIDQTPASQLDTIVPSISDGTPSAIASEYILNGHFGSDQGSVTLGGTALQVRSWSPTQVYVLTPPTNGDIVVKAEGLTSNTFPYAGLVVSPATTSVAGGATVQYTVKPVAGTTGTVDYKWTQTTLDGEFQSADKDFGNSIVTKSTSVGLLTTVHDSTPDTVTVVENVTNSAGVKTQVGKAVATVSFISLALSPTSAQLAFGAQKAFTVGAPNGGALPAGVTYKWTLTGKGSLAGGNPATTIQPSITYTAPSTVETAVLQVQVIASDGTTLGTLSATINVGPTLTVTPGSLFLTYFQTHSLNVSIPKGAHLNGPPIFTWSFAAGNGSLGSLEQGIGSGSSVTTTDFGVDYTSPKSTDTIATLSVVAKNSDGSLIGTGSATVYVRLLQVAGATSFGSYVDSESFVLTQTFQNNYNIEITYGSSQNGGGEMVLDIPTGTHLSVGQTLVFPGVTGNNVNNLTPGTFVFGGDIGEATMTITGVQTFPDGWFLVSYSFTGVADTGKGNFAIQYS